MKKTLLTLLITACSLVLFAQDDGTGTPPSYAGTTYTKYIKALPDGDSLKLTHAIGSDEIFVNDTTLVDWLNVHAGGNPGGANTQIQYNSAGEFAGSSSLTWNGSTLAVTGAGSITNGLNMNSTKVTNVLNPTAAQDAATKNYVDTNDVTIAGNTNNRVLTATGSTSANGEANLTFDGSTLTVTGAGTFSASADNVIKVNHSAGVLPTPSAGTVATFGKNNTAGSFANVAIISGNAGSSILEMGDADDTNIGRIRYDNSSNELSFDTNNTTRLSINSSGVSTFSGDFGVLKSSGNAAITAESSSINSTARIITKNDAQIWDIRTNGDDDFYIVDGTAVTIPVKIKPTAPTNSLIINNTGRVDMGAGSLITSGDLTLQSGRIFADASQQVVVDIDGSNTTSSMINIDNDNINTESFIRFQNSGASAASIGYNDQADVVGISHGATVGTAPDFYINSGANGFFSGDLSVQGNDLNIGTGLANDLSLKAAVATLPSVSISSPQIYGTTGAAGGNNGDLILAARMNAANRQIRFYGSTDGLSNSTDMLTLHPTNGATFSGGVTLSGYGSGSNTGTAAYSLAVDASGNVIEQGVTLSGTWTPVSSAKSNISSESTWYGQYIQVGDIVYFTIRNTVISVTSTGTAQLSLTLPVGSNFTSSYDAMGNITGSLNRAQGVVEADTANDLLKIVTEHSSTSGTLIVITGSYVVK